MPRVQPAVTYAPCPLANGLYIFAYTWEVREPEISYAGALCLCRLASCDFPRCRVVFSTTAGELGESPKSNACGALFSAGVPAEIFLALRFTH